MYTTVVLGTCKLKFEILKKFVGLSYFYSTFLLKWTLIPQILILQSSLRVLVKRRNEGRIEI